MSTKTRKRKRTYAPSRQAQAPAAVEQTPSVAAEPTIVLSSICTVKDAEALKGELLRYVDEPSVAIDAGNLERIDTAAMQLLCAFVRDRADRNLRVSWHGTPQPLFEAARLLGVGSMLALSAEATP
ncbi:MAG TPA: STAS domain-containing protein [Steroidobacteraceae bacterium]